jgi:hypothetical protein
VRHQLGDVFVDDRDERVDGLGVEASVDDSSVHLPHVDLRKSQMESSQVEILTRCCYQTCVEYLFQIVGFEPVEGVAQDGFDVGGFCCYNN